LSKVMEKMSKSISDAFELAYVKPYQSLNRHSSDYVDPELEGRDPKW
jgi:hypothetical protein